MFTRSLIFISASIFAYSVSAASFDCAKAKTETERLICTTPELSELDERLSEAYMTVLSRMNTKFLFKTSQKAWLSDIQKCKTVDCLKTEISKRTELLESVVTEGEIGAWTGEYARYSNGKVDHGTPANLFLLGLKVNRIYVYGYALGTYSSRGTHTGDIDGFGNVNNKQASFSLQEGNCKVEIDLKKPNLVVKDNNQCGGMNVTFTGNYKQQ
ncbi:lysozyme inhibitor LprI family protein [Chitinimonas sp. PSY-7]|uniref:lysozyme inhibitor LprI family protein n=1 Tax=Chitinimonas sp. PSY-7 TaxID=3459088 RepID=UPI00403FDDED